MLQVACYLYDDFALRWLDPASRSWLEYEDVLWMREHSLGDLCLFFGGAPVEIIAVADGVRVVNSPRLVAECRRRKIPCCAFDLVLSVAEAEGVSGDRFYSVGFGPGIHFRYR